MPDIIIKGGALLTPDGLKFNWGIRFNKQILEVGANETLTVNADDKVIEVYDQLIMPGFINGHNHMYGFLSHGISSEALVTEFSSFLDDFWWPYVENRIDKELACLTAKWACVEMINSGVTSFVDILEAPNALPGVLEAEAQIVRDAGLRGRLSFEACQRISTQNSELGLNENADFVRLHNHPNELVQGLISIHTLFTCNQNYIKKAKNLADSLKCDLHMHLSESVFEPQWAEKNYGKKPVEVYNQLHCLDQNILASQVVQCDSNELDILAEHKVRTVTMPLSNCEVGGGIAPVSQMLQKGITVGLGTDGYINNFFEVMRGAFLIHKAHLQDPQAMPAKTVINMATSMGANAIGINNTGKLLPGYLADIITISLDTPTPINDRNVYDQLILFCNPQSVKNVWVDGKQLKENGKILTIDVTNTKLELRQAASNFWKKP